MRSLDVCLIALTAISALTSYVLWALDVRPRLRPAVVQCRIGAQGDL